TWQYYYETGGIQREEHLKNGQRTGKSMVWQPNQKLQSVMNYKIIKDSRKGHDQSVLDGSMIIYDKNGAEISRIEYKNGRKVN
ncbi:MAG: hypothetical protein ABI388_07635, partial [Bacteroidia bacterium]